MMRPSTRPCRPTPHASRTGRPSTRRRSTLLAVGAVVALASMTLPALSNQSPEGCTSNDPVLNVTKDRTFVRNGDTITYHVEVHNMSTPTGQACNFSGATVAITVPGPDGTPSGPRTVLAENLDLPAGTGLTQFRPVTWTVALNPGVEDAVVKAEVAGLIHDAPVDHHALVVKTLGTTVTNALTELSVVANPASGQAPLKVTYTYTERNTGNAPIRGITLTDDVCAPITHAGGDQSSDKVLGVKEVWTLTCTTTLTEPGTVKNHVRAVGTNTQDNRPHPEENASATVTVGGPGGRAAPPPSPPKVLGQKFPFPRELPRTS